MPHLVKDRKLERMLAYGLITLGAYMLYDAYEKRGATRPFLTKFLPGG